IKDKMRFAHMADCHIGSWRDPKLRDASTRAFLKAVNLCIEKEVDFVLIAGDLFNTALPGIDALKVVVTKLKELKDNNIQVYAILGSHDFSPSGKTIIDVLENAGLLINVMKGKIIDEKLNLEFTIDKKTGAKITGIFGKKGMLEKSHYKSLLKKELEQEKGFKIFMFHTALTEFKPEELDSMESQPLELLPKNFDYYAGGHVHYVFNKKEPGYGLIAYPGPLFPNSFSELEKLENGGFYIVEKTDKLELKYEPIVVYNVFSLNIGCNNKSPEQIKAEIEEKIKNREFINTIVTIRLAGTLDSGKPSDINMRDIFAKFYDNSAYFVMKNTSKLITKELDEIKIQTDSIEETEESLIKESIGQIKVDNLGIEEEEKLTKQLMAVLSREKQDGERVADFEKRIKEEIEKIIKLD
ncbi:MAG: exonuclease SbcCD subunit D, partial [Nanoarchaeota archaeon]|nr:exonuclease SbcCD subunit D [Nanoarchaeota archaeon]